MPSWMLTCDKCAIGFVHAKIDTTKLIDLLHPLKPPFPMSGLEIACPHCGHRAVYQQTDLRYGH
jgi:hypothetical protein